MEGGGCLIADSIAERNLLGIRISAVTTVQQRSKLSRLPESRALGVSALAVHGVMTGVMNAEHRYRLNRIEMLVPDGQPVRWAPNLIHHLRLKDRVYGPNLMLCVLERAAKESLPICLFGGTPELLDKLQTRICEKFPGLQVAAKIPSKFRKLNAAEKQQLIGKIKSSGAVITFVGLGCPRQEVWTYEFKDLLSMPVLAVGAAFNFHAGQLAQAPEWMQRTGLEWFYRLSKEPSACGNAICFSIRTTFRWSPCNGWV